MSERAADETSWRIGEHGTGKFRWFHLDGRDEAAMRWLDEDGHGLPPTARFNLTTAETRPRCQPLHDGVIINLRGPRQAQDEEGDPCRPGGAVPPRARPPRDRREAQRPRRLPHELRRVRCDAWVVVHYPRHRRGRHAGQLCDALQGHAQAPDGAVAAHPAEVSWKFHGN